MGTNHMGLIMWSPNIPMVTIDELDSRGFRGWWSPVHRLLGTLETTYGNIHLVNTLPWDGSTDGPVDVILMETKSQNNSGVKGFLRDIKPL